MTETVTQPLNPEITSLGLYSREQIESILNLTPEFIQSLVSFHGLLPLGQKTHLYQIQNIHEALINHATGTVVEPRRNVYTRDELRKMRKRKLNGPKEE